MKNKIITVLDSLMYYNYPAYSASVSCQSTLFKPKTFSYCLVVICIIMRFWCLVFRFINLFFTVIIVAFPYVFNLWRNMHNRRNHWNGEILACFPAYFTILINSKKLFWVSTSPKLYNKISMDLSMSPSL